MADWGKYLKNAVANVEQQLDKVLQENQTKSQSPAPSSVSPSSSSGIPRKPGRPDLQERLKRATNAKNSPNKSLEATSSEGEANGTTGQGSGASALPVDPAGSGGTGEHPETKSDSAEQSEPVEPAGDKPEADKPVPEIETADALAFAPDFSQLLSQARRVTLAHQNDDLLELFEALELFGTNYRAYNENVEQRLVSTSSKLAYLSADRAAVSSGLEQRVALLLEEGQRLSQQELKLGQIIKKLRAERAGSATAEALVKAKDKEIAELKAEIASSKGQIKEQEALVEYFRGMAESASATGLVGTSDSVSTQSNDGAQRAQGSSALQRRLEMTENSHEVAKRTWNDLESSLLARISELEAQAEARAQSATQLQGSIKEAQDSARTTRNQMIALQDELDAAEESWHAKEVAYKSELAALEAQLKQQREQPEESSPLPASNELHDEHPESSDRPTDSATIDDSRGDAGIVPGENPASGSDGGPFVHPGDPRIMGFGGLEYADSKDFAEGPVGPAGPFGSLADDFDQDDFDAAQPPILSRDDSRDAFDDNFSFMAPSASRRETSIVGSEFVSGSQLHIVKKLTITVRRLENELSTARRACELADRQREEAQGEVARLVDSQDNLAVLQQKYSDLESANADLSAQLSVLENQGIEKGERIDELEADVRDLKDMYREQVEALISEIEDLKTRR